MRLLLFTYIQREKETARARHMHTPAGQRPPGNPGSLSGQCMWQRSERVTGTHGIDSSHVCWTRASSDQAGRAGGLAYSVLLCAESDAGDKSCHSCTREVPEWKTSVVRLCPVSRQRCIMGNVYHQRILHAEYLIHLLVH